jgi:predicted DCC family thiol-disulfide oxidoreductase YuxK
MLPRAQKTSFIHDLGLSEAWLVYDGACPFCSAYVKYLRVRESVGVLHLVDARKGGPIVDEIRAARLDLNEGMVLKIGSRFFHGAACINVLAVLSSRSTWFDRINAAIFHSSAISRWIYPALRAGRGATTRILGRAPF